MDLSFGEQVKVLLKRRGMTIKDLAAILEEQTGRPTSRQNLTQKLGRNNFQEQDMREIARALGCGLFIQLVPLSELRTVTPVSPVPVTGVSDSSLPTVEAILAAAQLTVPTQAPAPEQSSSQPPISAQTPVSTQASASEQPPAVPESSDELSPSNPPSSEEHTLKTAASEKEEPSYYIEQKEPDKEVLTRQISALLNPLMHTERKKRPERNSSRFSSFRDTQNSAGDISQSVKPDEEPSSVPELSDSINPLTGEEYLNNTVRACPDQPGYIEVYDRSEHSWVKTNESEFRRFQEQKRALLGSDYEPPIYI